MGLFPTPTFPGVNPNENRGPELNTVSIVFFAVSFVTILLRLFSRWWTKIEFWADDYLILAAAVCCLNILFSPCSYYEM
jgi:hypothetical protein